MDNRFYKPSPVAAVPSTAARAAAGALPVAPLHAPAAVPRLPSRFHQALHASRALWRVLALLAATGCGAARRTRSATAAVRARAAAKAGG
jgi:hypothetical protein